MLKSRFPQIIVEIEAAVPEAIREGAEWVERDAKARVPVATGRLRDAIHVQDESDGTYVIGGDEDVWYGHLVEYGTVRTTPRPFLVPSLEQNRSEIEGAVRAILRRL